MNPCRHLHFVLLSPQPTHKLRCQHCHLNITPEELEGGYCPECYEAKGIKNSNFEEISTPGDGKTRYRCEECNAIIEVD